MMNSSWLTYCSLKLFSSLKQNTTIILACFFVEAATLLVMCELFSCDGLSILSLSFCLFGESMNFGFLYITIITVNQDEYLKTKNECSFTVFGVCYEICHLSCFYHIKHYSVSINFAVISCLYSLLTLCFFVLLLKHFCEKDSLIMSDVS